MNLQSLIKQRREIWAALIHLYQEQSLKLQPIWFAHPNRTISPSWNKMRGRQKEGKGKRKIRDIWLLKCWRRMRLPFCSSSLAAARVGASCGLPPSQFLLAQELRPLSPGDLLVVNSLRFGDTEGQGRGWGRCGVVASRSPSSAWLESWVHTEMLELRLYVSHFNQTSS